MKNKNPNLQIVNVIIKGRKILQTEISFRTISFLQTMKAVCWLKRFHLLWQTMKWQKNIRLQIRKKMLFDLEHFLLFR